MLALLALLTLVNVVPAPSLIPAPTPHCSSVADVDSEEFICALRAGNVTIDVESSAKYVNIKCETGGFPFQCKELPRLGALRERAVGSASLRGCTMPAGGIACALRALGAPPGSTGPHFLRLDNVSGGALASLRPEDLAGLPLQALMLYETHVPVTAPFLALAAVPALRNLTVIGATMRLLPEAFNSTPALVKLELVACGLTDLPTGTFRGLSRLRRLVVFNNNVTRVGGGAFEGLHALEELDLSASSVRELAGDAFAATPRLRIISLRNNLIAELDSQLFAGLVSLEEVRVRNGASLRVGARALAALPSLRRVELAHCRISVLSADTFEGSTALLELNLAHNQLTQLSPNLLRDLVNLQTLNLTGNLLKELPDGFFSGVGAVRAVDVSYNRLQLVSGGVFRGAGALRWLSLAHNSLTFAAPPGQDEYRELELAPPSPLALLTRLRYLDLAHNNISQLYDDWLVSMTDLESLNLSHNAFAYLWDIDFNFVQQNITVDFRYNKITTIVQTALSRLTAPYIISKAKILLNGNPFNCDCRLYGFVVREKDGPEEEGQGPNTQEARCATPAELRGSELQDVSPGALRCPLGAAPSGCSGEQQPHGRRLWLECAASPDPTTLDRLPADNNIANYSVALRLNGPPPPSLALSPLVTELDLSRLNLTEVPPAVLSAGLLELNLASNRLSVVQRQLLAAGGPQLRLAHNPLACDCAHAADVAVLQRNRARVTDYANVTCDTEELLSLKDAAALCDRWRATVIGSSLAGVGALMAIAALLAYVFRRELEYVLRACGALPDRSERKPYDAFVSFCHSDHWFVMDKLATELERGPRPYRLCLHHRDWRGGEWVPAQIARSVSDSRRTLVVLSEQYLESRWSLMEFRAALECALRENRVRLVVVMLSDVTTSAQLSADLRAYLRVNTYLTWGEPGFWRKLRVALGPPSRPENAVARPDKLSGSPLAASWLTAAGQRVENGAPPALPSVL